MMNDGLMSLAFIMKGNREFRLVLDIGYFHKIVGTCRRRVKDTRKSLGVVWVTFTREWPPRDFRVILIYEGRHKLFRVGYSYSHPSVAAERLLGYFDQFLMKADTNSSSWY